MNSIGNTFNENKEKFSDFSPLKKKSQINLHLLLLFLPFHELNLMPHSLHRADPLAPTAEVDPQPQRSPAPCLHALSLPCPHFFISNPACFQGWQLKTHPKKPTQKFIFFKFLIFYENNTNFFL
jgi:hypothetical protein